MSDLRDNNIDTWMRDVSSKLGALSADVTSIKDDVREIKTQTTKTNGRVSTLERWRSYLAGAVGVVLIIIGSIVKFYGKG